MATVRKRQWDSDGARKQAWIVVYKDGERNRRLKTFTHKKDADAYRLRVENEVERNEHIAPRAAITVSYLCDQYMEWVDGKCRNKLIGRSWFNCLEATIRRSIKPHFGNCKLTELTGAMIEKWFNDMRREGAKAATCRQRLYILKHIESFAVRRKLMKVRPISEGVMEFHGIKDDKIRTFSRDELVRLLKAARKRESLVVLIGSKGRRTKGGNFKEGCEARTECIVHLAAFCGLRWGEICALTLDAVDLDSRMVYVRQSLTRWDELKDPKTRAGIRDVPMAPHVVLLLRDYVDRFYVPTQRKLIFRTSTGGFLAGGNFHIHQWQTLLDRAGLSDGGERFHFHALRHFAASAMIAARLPITDVASLMGHSKFDMTLQIYAHAIVGGNDRHNALDAMAHGLISAPLVIDADRSPTRTPLVRVGNMGAT